MIIIIINIIIIVVSSITVLRITLLKTYLLLKSYLQLIHFPKKSISSKHYLQFLSLKKPVSFDWKKLNFMIIIII